MTTCSKRETGHRRLVALTTLGDTTVFRSTTVNAVRFAHEPQRSRQLPTPFFRPKDIGANLQLRPSRMVMNVTGGFEISRVNQARGIPQRHVSDCRRFDDCPRAIISWRRRARTVLGWLLPLDIARNGNWLIDGRVTGSGLGDLLIGRITSIEHGAKNVLNIDNWYLGLYAQDSWRLSSAAHAQFRHALGAVLRSERPEQRRLDLRHGEVPAGDQSTVFLNAPAGLIYPGDEKFPAGQTGLNKQWWNLSPRGGFAWDVRGDGRLSVRSSYPWATTSCRASTTTSTPARHPSATDRSSTIQPG